MRTKIYWRFRIIVPVFYKIRKGYVEIYPSSLWWWTLERKMMVWGMMSSLLNIGSPPLLTTERFLTCRLSNANYGLVQCFQTLWVWLKYGLAIEARKRWSWWFELARCTRWRHSLNPRHISILLWARFRVPSTFWWILRRMAVVEPSNHCGLFILYLRCLLFNQPHTWGRWTIPLCFSS